MFFPCCVHVNGLGDIMDEISRCLEGTLMVFDKYTRRMGRSKIFFEKNWNFREK